MLFSLRNLSELSFIQIHEIQCNPICYNPSSQARVQDSFLSNRRLLSNSQFSSRKWISRSALLFSYNQEFCHTTSSDLKRVLSLPQSYFSCFKGPYSSNPKERTLLTSLLEIKPSIERANFNTTLESLDSRKVQLKPARSH